MMPRYVIKTVDEDGTIGACTAFDGIADNEENAKQRMARSYGHQDYESLLNCGDFAGPRDRIVITEEPMQVAVEGEHYHFLIHESGKGDERVEMWDAEVELLNLRTGHVSPSMNLDVLKLIERAYREGYDAGEIDGAHKARAEIRRVLEIA